MGEIISLKQEREARDPHIEGTVHCAACGHVWIAAAPVGTTNLECSECHTMRGMWVHPFGPDEHAQIYSCLTCGASSLVAYRSANDPNQTKFMCGGCGSAQSLESLFP